MNDTKYVDEKVCKVRHENTDKQLDRLNEAIISMSIKIDKLLSKNGISS